MEEPLWRRRVCFALGATLALLLFFAAPALAQQQPPPAAGAQIVVQERIPYVESLVVAVLCGAAIFAVCRSSRRN